MSIEEQKQFLEAFAEAEQLKVGKFTFFVRNSMGKKDKPEKAQPKDKEQDNS